jgi:hypothetical protein
MKYLKIFFVSVFLLFTVFYTNINAEESKAKPEQSPAKVEKSQVSGSASVDIVSNYVWRGQKFSQNVVYQPSVGLNYKGFGVNFWANYDDQTKELTELDLTLKYGYSFSIVSLEAGYINYAFDNAEDTQEVYGSIGLDIPLHPSVTYYYDYDVGDGGYVNAGISESVSVNKVLNKLFRIDLKEMIKREIIFNAGASVGVNIDNEVLGFDSNGKKFTDFYDGNVKLSFDIPIIDKISVSPYIAYSFALSNDAKTAIKAISVDGDKDVLYGGASIAFSF